MMNFENFRRTGELSDITIIVDETEFKLHTFPLFTKSEFFKKSLSSITPPFIIHLDKNFPGNAQIFNQLADYFYSIPIIINEKNLVPLRCSACFIQCYTLELLLDKRLDEILILSRQKHDFNIPFNFIEQSINQYKQWMKQTKIIDRCLICIIELLTRGVNLQLNHINQDILIRLPLEYFIQLIQLCPKDKHVEFLPIIKHYITTYVLQSNEITNDNKREILDEIIQIFGKNFEQYPLIWLNLIYEKSLELNCKTESNLISYIIEVILHRKNFQHNFENIPDDVIVKLLEHISKHKDEHIKDPQLLSKLSTLIDSYVEQLRQRGTLTSEQFVQLASCIPKENRDSHDSLLLALDEILKDEKSLDMSTNEREELLKQIDFSRISEETILTCKTNKLIPQQLITDAALAVCKKLRKQLDDTHRRLQFIENDSQRYRSNYNSHSKYRTRHFDSSLPSTISRNNSINNYSKYNLDYLLPSRYRSSTLNNRFGSFSVYRQ